MKIKVITIHVFFVCVCFSVIAIKPYIVSHVSLKLKKKYNKKKNNNNNEKNNLLLLKI